MHELTKENIEHTNAKDKLAGDKGRKHVVFAPGDLVWLLSVSKPADLG